MVAVINGLGVMMNMTDLTVSGEGEKLERLLQGIYTSAVVVMGIWFSFEYIAQGAFVARVYREYSERYAYLEEQAAAGVEDVEVPLLRPDWKCKFTEMAYDADIIEGWEEPTPENSIYWINSLYANHYKYGFDSLTGVPREDWTEY